MHDYIYSFGYFTSYGTKSPHTYHVITPITLANNLTITLANYSFFEQSHSHRKGFIYYVSSHIKNISMTTWQMGVSCKGGGGLFKKNTDQQIPYAHLYSVLSIPSYFTWWTLWRHIIMSLRASCPCNIFLEPCFYYFFRSFLHLRRATVHA